MSLDRLLKEEKELEDLMFNNATEDTPEPDDSAVPEDTDELQDIVEQPVQETIVEDTMEEVEEVPTEPERKPRTSWKKRYTNYKSSTDQKLFTQRREIADSKEKIAALTSEVDDLLRELANTSTSKDPFKEAITQEDEDLLGSEAIDVMKRATDAATKDLKAELEGLRKEKNERAKREAQTARDMSMSDLRARLDLYVEGWEDVDLDPKFGNYLSQVDPLSGYDRKTLFANSIQAGDVEGVARFYKGFMETIPPSKESILERKVAPLGEGAGTQVGDKINPKVRTYTIAEYDAVYEALNKGSYKSKAEKEQLIKKAALLDQAFTQGRITG